MKKDDCIFCKLANGVIPTNSLYEDDVVKVIFDELTGFFGPTLTPNLEVYANSIFHFYYQSGWFYDL